MFSKLILRNSKRERNENGLFLGSLIISIIAFYIILSLANQDVMIFLAKMESDAVNKLMKIVPVFYGVTLFILFFLIFYASNYQMERRRHEFGVYLIMGMRRFKLFALLLAEDIYNSLTALVIGLPVAVLLSELISLITARVVGMGIIEHRISFSCEAVWWTAFGFLSIKLAVFLILSGKISRQEIAKLLVDTPDGTKKQLHKGVYVLSLVLGTGCLVIAYCMAIKGMSWSGAGEMMLTVILGIMGTFLLFYGLRFVIGILTGCEGKNRQLHVFNFRQIQETVIHKSGTMAVCSLLILAAICFLGAGVAFASYHGAQQHVLDYTFQCSEKYPSVTVIRDTLEKYGLSGYFSDLSEMKIGHIQTSDDYDHAFQMDSVMTVLKEMDESDERDVLLNNFLLLETYPYLIALSDYNHLLSTAGKPELNLDVNEAGIYMDGDFTTPERIRILNDILVNRPVVYIDKTKFCLAGDVQSTSLVTDRYITLSFALILPDEVFEYYTQNKYEVFLNGVLSTDFIGETSLLQAVSKMNDKLNQTGLEYESYLQNMGRQLFYMVAASYITIYLAIIFLIIANTVIGVQFLMGQRKANRRFMTLVHLGATYEILCKASAKQINWYFGMPTVVAVVSSMFGIRALFRGLLPSGARDSLSGMLIISVAVILVLCVVEYLYMTVVKRSANKYLMTIMTPVREE